MTLRHTAAFALIGWYLMLPAQMPDGRGAAIASPAPAAPASIWDFYNTHHECEQARRQYLDDPVIGQRMKAAKCLPAPHDPRPAK